MPKHLVIKKSELTTAIRNLSTHNEDAVYLEIPDADEQDLLDELNGITSSNWILSDDVSMKSGEITDTIVLPRKVVEG